MALSWSEVARDWGGLAGAWPAGWGWMVGVRRGLQGGHQAKGLIYGKNNGENGFQPAGSTSPSPRGARAHKRQNASKKSGVSPSGRRYHAIAKRKVDANNKMWQPKRLN